LSRDRDKTQRFSVKSALEAKYFDIQFSGKIISFEPTEFIPRLHKEPNIRY